MATSEAPFPVTCPSIVEESPSALHVRPLEESDSREWDRFVQAHPRGTFFHQIAWKRVMEKTYGYRPYYFLAARGDRVTGIAPAFLTSSWMTGKRLISIPFAVYGGICAADDATEQALLAHLEQLASDIGAEYIELRNRDGGTKENYIANHRYATFTLPITADTEAVYRAFPKDIRYMIRKAEKANLRTQRGFDQLEQFYELMTINLRRLGTPAFPRSLFENLVREYPEQVDLTLVYSGNTPVCGGMSFLFRDTLQPYYIGSKEEAKALAANNFLWWQLIKLAAETGHTTFDFGRSKLNSGNYEFKKKWNPRIELLDYQIRLLRRKHAPDFSPANPKFEFATNMWKKLPLGVTRIFGPRLVRWFP